MCAKLTTCLAFVELRISGGYCFKTNNTSSGGGGGGGGSGNGSNVTSAGGTIGTGFAGIDDMDDILIVTARQSESAILWANYLKARFDKITKQRGRKPFK